MWSSTETLVGAFAAGVIEGASGKAKGIDGGEFYDLNTKEAFVKAYNFCKYGIIGNNITAPFLDDKLRSEWALKFNASYGIYDNQAPDKPNWEWIEWIPFKDLNLLTERIKWAMNYSDEYVWLFNVNYDWFGKPEDIKIGQWNPPAVPQNWIDAAAKGLAEARQMGN